MATTNLPTEPKLFKNTFAPRCDNEYLRVHDVITGLKFGAFRIDGLPREVRDAAREELERRDAAGETTG